MEPEQCDELEAFPWTLCKACNASFPHGFFRGVAAPYYKGPKYTKCALSLQIGARSCTHQPALFLRTVYLPET